MKITQRLVKVQLAVLDNKVNGDGSYGKKVGEAAEAAMTKGMTAADGTVSEDWKRYMSLFADSADQLKRLTTTELDGDDEYLSRIRAYIVANGVCAPGTDAKTINGTRNFMADGSDIDNAKPNNDPLSEAVDATIVALRPIPVN
jgi:hypothetical protein